MKPIHTFQTPLMHVPLVCPCHSLMPFVSVMYLFASLDRVSTLEKWWFFGLHSICRVTSATPGWAPLSKIFTFKGMTFTTHWWSFLSVTISLVKPQRLFDWLTYWLAQVGYMACQIPSNLVLKLCVENLPSLKLRYKRNNSKLFRLFLPPFFTLESRPHYGSEPQLLYG
jgi:hypothetical protein